MNNKVSKAKLLKKIMPFALSVTIIGGLVTTPLQVFATTFPKHVLAKKVKEAEEVVDNLFDGFGRLIQGITTRHITFAEKLVNKSTEGSLKEVLLYKVNLARKLDNKLKEKQEEKVIKAGYNK